ncbi:hypothetical protein [Cyanobium sp. PCC 7001]|uniref:hypothetical protein n=1 Tax=Cyanobium sp. PCC 7001 TaxID=180281 RepID=UPI0018DD1F40|nr:hypothetical protein [Cyanobium sp. PCC 7001]
MSKRENSRGVLKLSGNSGWAGKSVVDRTVINPGRVDGRPNKVVVDRGMFASLSYQGKDALVDPTSKAVRKGRSALNSQFDPGSKAFRDVIIMKAQAGTISKRFNSVFDLGADKARDVWVFSNTTQKHGPFNHMQRIRIKNFGREDRIVLRNIGRTFRFKDLRRIGNGVYGLSGVPTDKLNITLVDGLR